MKNQQWRLSSRPEGLIGPEHFERGMETVLDLTAGQVLVKNLYLSFDPTQRGCSAYWQWKVRLTLY